MYGNRRRIRGEHGKEPLRRCGGLLERSFAHAYETGWRAARALAGGKNILKRVLMQGLSVDVPLILLRFWIAALVHAEPECTSVTMPVPSLAVRMVVLIPLAAQ